MKNFTFNCFDSEEEAKDYIKKRRLRKYTLGYSYYWKCYILSYYIYN